MNLDDEVAMTKAIEVYERRNDPVEPGAMAAFLAFLFPAVPRARKRTITAERCPSEEAAAILGLPHRTVQDMAARGELPGAAKFGRRWTFDREKLRRFVRQEERRAWLNGEHQQDAIGAVASSTAGLRSTAGNTDGRFTQIIRRLRGRGTKPGKKD